MSKKFQEAFYETILHQDLAGIKSLLYDPCGFKCSQLIKETESAEYGAYTFQLNDFFIRFRVAKITPTKTGQFVTLWKRIGNKPIQPYDISDQIDFFVVSTRKDNYFGQFVFPKVVLHEQGILSVNGKGGKRAIRVYPPWDNDLNKQAQKTQRWQINYFLEIPQDNKIDYARAEMLYLPK
jgi:hypothetical protein